MKHNPYKIVKMFEEEVAEYCNAPYAVSVDSCTNALFLSLMHFKGKNGKVKVTIPLKTYLSVPQQILLSGHELEFEDYHWKGQYWLSGTNIIDSAKRLTSDMYIPGTMMCLSFHQKKHIPIGKGGMILLDDRDAYEWLKKARYEGRSEVKYHDDNIQMLGWNMYLTPVEAATGLCFMQHYPKHVEDLPEYPEYRPLNEFDVFKNVRVI